MQNFLSFWLNAGAQITHGFQVQRPRQKRAKKDCLAIVHFTLDYDGLIEGTLPVLFAL